MKKYLRHFLEICSHPVTAVVATSLYVVLLFMSAYQCWYHPIANWDALPYTGLALRWDGTSDDQLRTYSLNEVRLAFPDRYDGFVEGSDYVKTVATNDASFSAQLPFYTVKPLYIAGVFLLGKLEGNFGIATAHVSAIAFFIVGIVAAIARPKATPTPIWLLGLVLISTYTGPFPLSLLASASSPDALSGALFLGGIVLVGNGMLGLAAPLLLLSQLARPDAIVPVLIFLVTLAAVNRRHRVLLLSIAVLAICTRQAVTMFVESYPLAVLMSTLIHPQPYPGEMRLIIGSTEYMRILFVFLEGLAVNPRFILITLVGLCSLALSLKKRAGWPMVLLLTALSNILAHVLLFPEVGGYYERFFFTSYLLIFMATASIVVKGK